MSHRRITSRITKLPKPVRHIMAAVEHDNHVEYTWLCIAPEDAYPMLERIGDVTCQPCLEEVVRRGVQV